MSRLKTISEAAHDTGLSERFLRTLVFEKRITFHKLGSRVFFAPKDLDAFIEAGRVEAQWDSSHNRLRAAARNGGGRGG